MYYVVWCEGIETEVNAGILEPKLTRTPYFLAFMRHIDSLQQRLDDALAPRYVDIIEHNKIRSIDRARMSRLQQLKVRTTSFRHLGDRTSMGPIPLNSYPLLPVIN